ncbi:hypothetical protein AAC387_Pa11g2023 [Persea americana]
MDASFSPQNSHGIMDEEEHLCDSLSSSSDVSSHSISSSSSDLTEDASSSSSSTPSSSLLGQLTVGPLYEMSSLIEELPIKRGLSKHFQGRSQSFTSLSNVRCLEDLAKPENPWRKKLKSCKSYGGGLDSPRSYAPRTASKTISKKASRSSWGSLLSRKNKPPIPSHKTSSFSSQTHLFA